VFLRCGADRYTKVSYNEFDDSLPQKAENCKESLFVLHAWTALVEWRKPFSLASEPVPKRLPVGRSINCRR
jgi:hypothetical protein